MRISDWSSDVCSSDLSNVVPSAFRRLADLARAGKEADAQALDARPRALYDFLGIESNPIPVKALLARRGVRRDLRQPRTERSAAHAGPAARTAETAAWIQGVLAPAHTDSSAPVTEKGRAAR